MSTSHPTAPLSYLIVTSLFNKSAVYRLYRQLKAGYPTFVRYCSSVLMAKAGKINVRDMVHGKASHTHEPMKDVLHGWDLRVAEVRKRNALIRGDNKRRGQVRTVRKSQHDGILPSQLDKDFRYGKSTYDIDVHADPLYHSNAIIAQRVAQQDREIKRAEETKAKPQKRLDPARPTRASIGHTIRQTGELTLKDTFKMKRFTQFDHGKIDTGLHKAA